MTTIYSKTFWVFLFSLIFCKNLLACTCYIPTIEEEYKRSELVVMGKIVGVDTITAGNYIWQDKQGIKYGKHKYSIGFEDLVRVKLIPEINFKSSTQLPDTIYILTSTQSTACGYQFPPYYTQIPSSYYDFIIYADRWIDYSIEEVAKDNRRIKQIKRTILQNTFFTSKCRLTQHSSEEELNKLKKLKT